MKKTAKQLLGRISQCYPIYAYYIISQLVSQILNHQASVTTWESKHYSDISWFDVKKAGNMPSSPRQKLAYSKWETNIRTIFKGTQNLHLYGHFHTQSLPEKKLPTKDKTKQNKTNVFSKKAPGYSMWLFYSLVLGHLTFIRVTQGSPQKGPPKRFHVIIHLNHLPKYWMYGICTYI